MQIDVETLKEKQQNPQTWTDLSLSKDIAQKLKQKQDKLSFLKTLQTKLNDLDAICDILEIETDVSLYEELEKELNNLSEILETMKLQTLLKGKYDSNNCIISLHAGAGGTEAQDWTEMLFRMYQMFCEKQGFSITVLDELSGDEAGIKTISFSVIGENAYGYLKAEKGVHRLVRISPFDSNSRRHTSFSSVEVMPEIDDETIIEIKQEDLRIDTFRSSGAGGQHVNKTESAIRITHLPTKIVVACQNERSQLQNRETAMKMLRSKLLELKELKEQEKLDALRGSIKKIEWGSQIRSYVFHPYSMVKDHRTNFETSDINGVMNGNLMPFINDWLRKTVN